MEKYEDPKYAGNSSAYHTGKECMTEGCINPAGTAWSPYWCFECNAKRIRELDKQFDALGYGDKES